MDCLKPENELIRCLEATEDETKNRQCIKCYRNYQFINSETYNKKICDDKCDSVSFLKKDWCYKCDDKYYGNPGCVLERGCSYTASNDELDCNECKDGYFKYSQGQCYSCAYENKGCSKCHFNNEDPKGFECDECIEGYQKNAQTKKCEIIKCNEYPEVTQGCIICDNNLSTLKPKNECEACKEGFFKTKDKSCVYCKARKNGGPACEQCIYETDEDGNETNNIKCEYCPKGSVLSSDGKCLIVEKNWDMLVKIVVLL